MSVLVTAERFLNSLHYKKSPVGNRHPGPECRALEERCGSSTNQVSGCHSRMREELMSQKLSRESRSDPSSRSILYSSSRSDVWLH